MHSKHHLQLMMTTNGLVAFLDHLGVGLQRLLLYQRVGDVQLPQLLKQHKFTFRYSTPSALTEKDGAASAMPLHVNS